MKSTKSDKSARKSVPHKEISPSPPEINTLLALFTAGRYAEVAILAQTMTVRFPMHGFAWKVLGAVFKQLGRNADALAPMQKAAALSPSDFEAHTNLGITLHDLSRLDEAEVSYRRALQIKPDYAKAHYNLGVTLQALGRLDEAETSYRRALQVKSDFAEAHYNLGVTLQDLGRMNEAEASYRRVLQDKPDFAGAHYNLGITLQALGRMDEAEASYRRAIQIKPDYAHAHNNLGSTLRTLGRLEEAIAHFERALLLDPKLDKARFGLSNSLYVFSLVDYDKAIHLASRARQLFQEDPIILRGISGILGDTNISKDEAVYTQKLFDGFAATFESTLENLKYKTPKVLANEPSLGNGKVSRDLDILDAGCGTGLCGIYLRPAARTLVGVDLSAEMLRLAREKDIYDTLHEDNIINFCKNNKASFDLIVLADVLGYIGDIQELVESISFALRQNGIIALSAECMRDNASSDTFALQPSGRYQHSIEYLKRSLEDTGFSVKKITSHTLREEYGQSVAGRIVIAQL